MPIAKKKNVKLAVEVIVGPELTASMTRLFVADRLTARMNHRPERRSYRTSGSLAPVPFETLVQKVVSETFMAPRTPVLSNTLKRPLAATSTCVGPTSPMLSGGMLPDSLNVGGLRKMPRKLAPTA